MVPIGRAARKREPSEMELNRVGDITTGWGESTVWDDRQQRLWFVDCAAQTLHWLDDGATQVETWKLPTMPTGIVPTEDGLLLVVLDDGLHLVDADARTTQLVTSFPAAIGGRCNDACADLDGNVITGKLNLGPDPGSAWRWSRRDGWRVLDDDISNTNGPAATVIDGETTLIIGDTAKEYFRYAYDSETGVVGPRAVFGSMDGLDGRPDGSALDADGGLWCALVGGGQLARFTANGLDRTVALPVECPTDVAFGGPDLDRLYVTSIGVAGGVTAGEAGLDGALLVIDGLGVRGRPEPRCLV
jgi:sugar lactone lactonase YvrE